MLSRSAIRVIALFLLAMGMVLASPVGSISGTVKDPTGAPVANVKLKLTNTATNGESSATTNRNGEFQFLQLAPSTYSLEAESAGFKKITAPSVVVQVDQVT